MLFVSISLMSWEWWGGWGGGGGIGSGTEGKDNCLQKMWRRMDLRSNRRLGDVGFLWILRKFFKPPINFWKYLLCSHSREFGLAKTSFSLAKASYSGLTSALVLLSFTASLQPLYSRDCLDKNLVVLLVFIKWWMELCFYSFSQFVVYLLCTRPSSWSWDIEVYRIIRIVSYGAHSPADC